MLAVLSIFYGVAVTFLYICLYATDCQVYLCKVLDIVSGSDDGRSLDKGGGRIIVLCSMFTLLALFL